MNSSAIPPVPPDSSLTDFLRDFVHELPVAKPGAIVTCTRAELSDVVKFVIGMNSIQTRRESFEFMAVGCKGPLLGDKLVEHFLGPEDPEESPAEPPTAKVSRAVWSKTLCAFYRYHGQPIKFPRMARRGHRKGWNKTKAARGLGK